jgi:hypothetical protein
MPAWRFVLIAVYVVLTMTGVFVGHRHFALSMTLVGVGLAAISVHLILERSERMREEKMQLEWEDEIRRVAEDVSLDGYGIASLAELSRYHDAAGRAAVLEALRGLPVGQRTLVSAARQVDPDAVWD